MRWAVAAFLIVEAGWFASTMAVENQAEEVFDLGDLIHSADGYAKHLAPLPHGGKSTPLQRIEATKRALANKLLNREIAKLPFSEAQLGEGMAVDAIKKTGASSAFNSFKRLGKVLEAKKNAMKKRMLKAQRAKTAAQKKALQVRKNAAELRKKLRKSVPKSKAAKTDGKLKKLISKVKTLKKRVKAKKSEARKLKKHTRKKISTMKADLADKLRKRKKALRQKREQAMDDLKRYKDRLSKQWYVNMKTVSKWKKKVNGAKDQLKDLKSEVKNNDRVYKEMQVGLKAQFLTKERDYMKSEGKKLKKAVKKTAGEKQKETWDKLKVRHAKKKEKAESKIMGKAVKANEKIVGKEKAEASKLHKLKKKEHREVKGAERKVNKLKLKDDLEKIKQKRAEMKVAVTKTRAKRGSSKIMKKTAKMVKAVKKEEKKKMRRMKRRMLKLKAEYDTRERVEKADMQKDAIKQKEARDKMIQGIQTQERQVALKEQAERKAAIDEKMKEKKEKVKRRRIVKKLKRERKREKKVQKFLKKQVKKDAHRIEKRAGTRTVAAAEKKSLQKAAATIAQKDAALKRATKRARKLAKRKDMLQRMADKYKRKDKQAEFKAFLAKKKQRDMKLKLSKAKLKLSMAKKRTKHEIELGEAGEEKSALKAMEKKYKFQVKSNGAFRQQVQMLQAKNSLGDSKSLKWQSKAQKYKQMIQGAYNHAREVASRVRKEWAMKMIKEQDTHTKELMKLKNLMGKRQAAQDTEIVKLHAKADSAERMASKSKNAAGNQEAMSNYIAGLVSEQAVRARVLRVYMNKSMKIRQKYQKKLGSEWTNEIKRLKKELRGYQNGHKITALKYKVMKLKSKERESKKQKHIHLEVKRIQNLDIATLLHGAISSAQKGSEKRSAEANRKRVVNAVNAVVATVMAGDKIKGAKLAAKAKRAEAMPKAVDSASPPMTKVAVKKSTSMSGLQKQVERLTQQNALLQKKVAAGAALSAASKKKKVLQKTAHMTKKQRALWKQLHELVSASSVPSAAMKMTEERRVPYSEKPPLMRPVGALRKGVFLPAEEEEERGQ